MSLDPLPDTHPHVLGLTLGRDAAQVRLAGDVDLAALADLSRLMVSLDLLAYLPVVVDLSEVTFLDSSGVRPLVEATLRRRRGQLPPVRIGRCSPAARYFLDASGLNGRPHLDLAAWDHLADGGAVGRLRISLVAGGEAATITVLSARD
jgi:anti-anti-sigma factor